MPRLMISLLAGAMALSGCAVVPDLGGKPQMRGPAQFATQSSFAAPVADWPTEAWWTGYGDPQLDQLMGEALAGSPSLAQAAARVRSAQARAGEARSATLPSLGFNGQAAENKQSYNAGFPRAFVPQGYNDAGKATLDASFDLDLWGRNRAALAAATSEAEASLADAAQAKLLLTTNLAAAYADFVRLTAEHQAADASARNRATSADPVARR